MFNKQFGFVGSFCVIISVLLGGYGFNDTQKITVIFLAEPPDL
jgi:hypothetical protein